MEVMEALCCKELQSHDNLTMHTSDIIYGHLFCAIPEV